MIIVLVDKKIDMVQSWKNVLGHLDYVRILHGSILDVKCDAIVSPGNSFGFMDGGLDLKLSQTLGWHVQTRLQELIRKKHHGELLVGAADIVPTDDSRVPFIIYAPTMRVPGRLGKSANIYLATRAAVLLAKYGCFEDGRRIADVVYTVAFPGMGTGVGAINTDICAKQMKSAIDDFFSNLYVFPTSWQEAQAKQAYLCSEHDETL